MLQFRRLYSVVYFCDFFFFFKQKTAYEMRISDWSSDVCSSDLLIGRRTCSLDAVRTARALAWKAMHPACASPVAMPSPMPPLPPVTIEIGRASCRERVCQYV